MNTKHVSIIGFGRFGRLWSSIIKQDFRVTVFDNSPQAEAAATMIGVTPVELKEALTADTIFYCVPISQFEPVMARHASIFKELGGKKLIIDMLSVKLHARSVFETYLPPEYQAILCHPMFGPDSVKASGLAGQRIVLDRYRADSANFQLWVDYFKSKNLDVVEMAADQHDREIAASQGLTHLVARILEAAAFKPGLIETDSSASLRKIKENLCKDEWQLFIDMQKFNPYCKDMQEQFLRAQERIFQQLR